MKTKYFILTVMLCMTFFISPISVFAESDSEAPTITAKLQGNVIRIEASDNMGVEAVFIDENRINYRVDSILEIDSREYQSDNEKISIYAVDFAGNKSSIVEVKNPYYISFGDVDSEPIGTTESVINESFLTPDGTGSIVDNITDSTEKEFLTIQTPDGNIFYLILDKTRDENGVYLLNDVTEDDLAALAKKSDGGTSAIPTPEPTPTPTPEPTPEPQPETETTPEKKSNSGVIFFVLLLIGGVGGVGWYLKVYKPKQDSLFDSDDDEEEIELPNEADESEEYDDDEYEDY